MADLLAIALVVVIVWSVVQILNKAGYSGWWVLLGFVPLVNIAALYRFATADWPALRHRDHPAP